MNHISCFDKMFRICSGNTLRHSKSLVKSVLKVKVKFYHTRF